MAAALTIVLLHFLIDILIIVSYPVPNTLSLFPNSFGHISLVRLTSTFFPYSNNAHILLYNIQLKMDPFRKRLSCWLVVGRFAFVIAFIKFSLFVTSHKPWWMLIQRLFWQILVWISNMCKWYSKISNQITYDVMWCDVMVCVCVRFTRSFICSI